MPSRARSRTTSPGAWMRSEPGALDHTLPRVKNDERPASTRVIVYDSFMPTYSSSLDQRSARRPGTDTGRTCLRAATPSVYARAGRALGHSWRYSPNFTAKNRQGGACFAGYIRAMHENKVALVTGANKGIGHAIASAL